VVIVYVARCVTNNKLYFGVTGRGLATRIRQHVYMAKNPRTRFHTALRKYGVDGFEWLALASITDREEAFRLESLCISHFQTMDRLQGYNDTSGGEGSIPSDTTRAKMSAVRRGKPTWSKGKKLTPAQTAGRFGNRNRLGKQHSEEAKERMRLVHLGKKHSEETLTKMRGNTNAKGRGASRALMDQAVAQLLDVCRCRGTSVRGGASHNPALAHPSFTMKMKIGALTCRDTPSSAIPAR